MAEFVPFEGKLDQEGGFEEFKGQLDQPQPVRQRTFREKLGRQLGLTARAGITGVTGIGSALADFGVGAANLMGANLPTPSQELQKKLSQLGLPVPETTTEKVAGFGASALAGAMDPGLVGVSRMAAQLAPKGFDGAKQVAKTEVIGELRKAGYKLPPTEMSGGTISRTTEGIGGPARTAELAQVKNQEITQRLARDALGLPRDTPLTADVLRKQAQDLIEHGYEPIRGLKQITIGGKYRGDLRSILSDFAGSDSFPAASRDQVRNLVNRYMYDNSGRYLQKYTGFDALKEIKLLRREAGTNFKPGGDPLLGEAQRRIATAIEDNIELNLHNNQQYKNIPHLLDNFRDARTYLAKNFAVERMLTDPDTGVVSTTKAAQLLRSGTPLTGKLHTIAKAGSPSFARATGVPARGNPPPINYGDNMFMVGGLAGAPFTGGVSTLAAGIPVVRAAARQSILSEPVQKALMRNLASQGRLFSSGIGQRSLLSAPLFTQGEQ